VEFGKLLGQGGGYPQWVKSHSRAGWGVRQRVANRGAVLVAETFTGPEYLPADALFIAEARSDVPRLIAEVRALRTRLRLARAGALARPVMVIGWLLGAVGWAYLLLGVFG
jgi:hypothetical protein